MAVYNALGMDKNNDIQVNKVNKWDYGVVDMSLWHLKDEFDALVDKLNGVYGIDVFEIEELARDMYSSIDKVLERFNELEAVHHKDTGMISQYEEELRIREKEKDEKDKLIDELNSKIMMLKLRTNAMYGCYGLNSKYGELLKKIQKLEKENKDLRYTIERNEDFGKYVGKCVAESIREGWEHNLYRLHPYTRIDIHVEQITDMPFAFNHCAIPNVSVMFNNTQTEMERDTAQHECEELEKEKIDLEKENNNLTTDTKRLSDAVEAWFNMFNDMRHKRDFLKKEYKKLKETNKSCPVACECENFKPKVHHSCDPLDDLPDVEHS